MPIECLIGLIIWSLAAVIIVLIVEALITMFLPVPAQVFMLIRLLVGLLVLLQALECLGLLDTRFFYHRRL